ncbi:MAG TPA: hypothetical protein DEO82_05500 [Eubacterium sp.]|nr:hypothetical protein [Eubacterium sp.]
MKKSISQGYLRYVFLAFILGILISFGHVVNSYYKTINDFVEIIDMRNENITYGFLYDLIMINIPYIVFHIFFGTYIYRRFCSASIYFFVRNVNRVKWFLSEIFKLYIYAVMYCLFYVMGNCFLPVFSFRYGVRSGLLFEVIMYVVITSLYLLVTALAINVLAVLFDSNLAFVICQFVYCFFLTFYLWPGTYHYDNELEAIDPDYMWMIKCNPFSYIVFYYRKTMMDYVTSIMLYVCMLFIIILAGMYIVKRHNFIVSNQEYE